MASNDSLIYINSGEANAFKLVDLSNNYYVDDNFNVNLKNDDLVFATQEQDFIYYTSNITNNLYLDLVNNMLESNVIESIEDKYFANYFEDITPYLDERTNAFKITDTKSGKSYGFTATAKIYPDAIGGDTDILSFESWGITDLNFVGSYTKPPYETIAPIAKPIFNKDIQTKMYLSVGKLYNNEGKLFLLFLTKYGETDTYITTWLTNDDKITEGILTVQETIPHNITNLSFNLADSDTFNYGEEATEGGYSGGSWDNSSDNIGIPSDPSFDFTTQGCNILYKVNSLSNIMNELFPDVDESASGLDFLKNIFEIQQSDSLRQYLIDAYAIPITPTLGNNEPITIGWKRLNQTGQRVRKQWKTVNCGTYNLKEYYSNFLDYEGTEIKLYLPFIGFVDISTEFIVSGSIEIVYKFDVYSGEFIAFVKSNSGKSNLNSVIASYNGSAITHLPLNYINQTPKVNGLINGASGVLSGVANLASGKLSGISDIAKGATDLVNARPTPSLSNAYSGSGALMSIRTPYFLISRQVGQFSSKYRKEVGLPLNVAKKLSDVHGFTICQIDDIGIAEATSEEREQIVNLLRSGIIL